MRIDLVPSGVECVDAELGGIALRQICLVSGAPSTGKTSFAISFLSSALQRGEACCMVTTDRPESVLEFGAQYFELDIEPFLRARKLTLLNFGPSFENKIRSLGSVDRPFGEIGELAKQRGVRHLVFDSFDPVLTATDAASLKQFVRNIIGASGQLGLTCLWTVQAVESGSLRLGAEELASQAACSIELSKSTSSRSLAIHNATWCAPSRDTLAIDFVRGKGIVSSQIQPQPIAQPEPAAPAPGWQGEVKTVMLSSDGISVPRESVAAPASADNITATQRAEGVVVVTGSDNVVVSDDDGEEVTAKREDPSALKDEDAAQAKLFLSDVLQSVEHQYLERGSAGDDRPKSAAGTFYSDGKKSKDQGES